MMMMIAANDDAQAGYTREKDAAQGVQYLRVRVWCLVLQILRPEPHMA